MSNEFADIESPSVQAEVNPAAAKLGDLITLQIRVTHPQALVVDPPAFAEASAGRPALGTFEVFSSTRLPTELSGDKVIDRFQALLQNFTTGQQVLPGVDVPYVDPMGAVKTVKTPSLTVTIEEVPPGPKDQGTIRGIKGVIGPTAWSPWWWLAAAVLVAAAGVLLWRRRQAARRGPPPPPPVPADITALEKLNTLEATDWLTTGKIKDYYSALSEIVREYLEKGFEVSALERTTGELMRDLRRVSDIRTAPQGQLRELLDACDLVKFAKYRPDADEGAAALQSARRFVEDTQEAYHARTDAPSPEALKR